MFGGAVSRPAHKSVEWYTPAWIFDELGIAFDLDPASPHDMESAVPASVKYTVFDDGLKKPWFGRVWMNPPYGPTTGLWVNRMIAHGNGIALVFSRTDASWCQDAMRAATATLFLSGRVEFIPGVENQHKRGRSGAVPCCSPLATNARSRSSGWLIAVCSTVAAMQNQMRSLVT